MQSTETLGRATIHHITPRGRVGLSNREIRRLKRIERHGPQSAQTLYELTRRTHRCKDTARRQLQTLRAGGYPMLPRQQRAAERAEFNPFICDLTKRGKDQLVDLGLDAATVRPTRHLRHGYSV